jgi:hypothetical protein
MAVLYMTTPDSELANEQRPDVPVGLARIVYEPPPVGTVSVKPKPETVGVVADHRPSIRPKL